MEFFSRFPHIYCNCPDKQTTFEGNGEFRASEFYCELHGITNTCYVCNPGLLNTERCRIHSARLQEVLNGSPTG